MHLSIWVGRSWLQPEPLEKRFDNAKDTMVYSNKTFINYQKSKNTSSLTWKMLWQEEDEELSRLLAQEVEAKPEKVPHHHIVIFLMHYSGK